jgi:hypothetical protein
MLEKVRKFKDFLYIFYNLKHLYCKSLGERGFGFDGNVSKNEHIKRSYGVYGLLD